jgi:predicted PurR-regulated permease PerM
VVASGTQLTKLQRITYRVWFAVGLVVLIYATYRFLSRPLGIVIPPVLVAVLIVYLLNPAVTVLERKRVPRWAGTAISYIAVAALLTGLSMVLVPALSRQLSSFAVLVPDIGDRLVQSVNDALAFVGLDVQVGTTLSGESLAQEIQAFLTTESNRNAALAILGGISGLATGVFHFVVAFVLGPVIAFYVLVDLPRLLDLARKLPPPHMRAEADVIAGKLVFVVGGYVRGQLLVATFVGVACTIGLAVIGLPFWLVLGVIAGVTNLIPLIGPFVAGLLGVGVALVSDGVGLAVLVVVVMTAIQQVDSHVLSPIVVGHTVRVHPMVVLFALLIAGTTFGIFGMLVAVPLVAAVKVVGMHLWQTRVPWAQGVEPVPDTVPVTELESS